MTASLSDILTAAKNIVTALNDSARQTFLLAGSQIGAGITTPTLLLTGQGRLVTISVTGAGTGGVIYDSGTAATNNRPLCNIPATAGVYKIDLPFSFGLYVVPSGTTVTVSYSEGGLARSNT